MKQLAQILRKHIGRFECIAFITGFTLMAYELAASRILAPSIGTSTYVWTGVIGVMIAALAAGYAVGGWIADHRVAETDIAWLLLLSALAIVSSGALSESTLSLVLAAVGDPRLQAVLAALLLFAPASFLVGTISPYLARLRVHSVTTTGRSVAGLSALNSFGGIAGTFCTGFIFFSLIGSHETFTLIAVVLAICSWFISPRANLRPRLGITAAAVLLSMLQLFTPLQPGVVAALDTPTSHYKVVDMLYNGEPLRALIMGPGGLQSGVYTQQASSGRLAFNYASYMAEAVAAAPHKDRILILGGGAFTLPEYFGRLYPTSHIDVVELDPALPAIAAKYFDYNALPNVRIITQDARTYIRDKPTPYDIILVDAYNDSSVPFALTTREYTEELKQTLAPSGVVMVNIIAGSEEKCIPLLASMDGSYRRAFSHSLITPLRGAEFVGLQNMMALYANTPLDWASSLSKPAYANNPDPKKARTLTDNFAPIESLKERCK